MLEVFALYSPEAVPLFSPVPNIYTQVVLFLFFPNKKMHFTGNPNSRLASASNWLCSWAGHLGTLFCLLQNVGSG